MPNVTVTDYTGRRLPGMFCTLNLFLLAQTERGGLSVGRGDGLVIVGCERWGYIGLPPGDAVGLAELLEKALALAGESSDWSTNLDKLIKGLRGMAAREAS